MSWDILIQDFGEYAEFSDIPDDFAPKPIGQRSAIIKAIQTGVPEANFSDPSWGMVDTIDGSIEINIGDGEVCDSVMLHVRGGEAIYKRVVDIVALIPGRAADMATGEFFDPKTSDKSFESWREYRDHVAAVQGAESVKESLLKRLMSRIFGPIH